MATRNAIQIDAIGRITTPENGWHLMLLGDATITVKHIVSYRHKTYRICRARDNVNLWFVSVLGGPDSFDYLGTIRRTESFYKGEKQISHWYNHGMKSHLSRVSDPNILFIQLFETAKHEQSAWPTFLQVFHAGRCCRCGRKLTHPESIEMGIGPECAGKE